MSRGQPLLTEPPPPPWTPETGCNSDLGAASLFRIRLTALSARYHPVPVSGEQSARDVKPYVRKRREV